MQLDAACDLFAKVAPGFRAEKVLVRGHETRAFMLALNHCHLECHVAPPGESASQP
jgi:hypothetical protein